MSSPLSSKKRHLTQQKEISPPPLRRKRNNNSSANATVSELLPARGPDLNRFEIISWNVNGVSHLLPTSERKITSFFSRAAKATVETDGEESDTESSGKEGPPLRAFLRRHGFPQMVCLQEVKIAPKDEATKKAVQRAANPQRTGEEGPRYEVHFSLPRDRFNARGWGGKVYGVCTLIRTHILSPTEQEESVETREVDWDLEGRVLVTKFERWKLAVINGYWVNGTVNPWRDSESGAVRGTRHDAKRHFHSLMLSEVMKYESDGWNVVLVGDMNIARSPIDGYPGIRLGIEHVKNRSDFNSKFFDSEDGMKGIDTWRHIHGNKRGYTYHGENVEEWGRSCDRVDLGIVSRLLVDNGALIGTEIWESVEERGGSDHVPLAVVLDLGKLVARGEKGRAGGDGEEAVNSRLGVC